METKKHRVELIINTVKKGQLKTELKDGRWGGSVHSLIDVATFSFKETDKIRYADLERGDEIVLKVVGGKGNKGDFYYWIESVTTHFETDEKSGEMKTNDIILQATSYPSILTKNDIEGTHKFTQGYGEIVKKFSKKYGFKTDKIKMIKKKGFINFKKMTILEAFRRMAYIEGWCLNFRDKQIVFQPCMPPENSGVVITDKEMISGTFTK